jgi:uncharacterized membrane protein
MKTQQLLLPLGSGAVAGLRSMTGPATALRGTKWQRALPLLAITEFVVDKLPKTPARTVRPALAVRLITGAISGAVTSQRTGGKRWTGALLGSSAAVGTAYLGVAYRKAAAQKNVPPVIAGLLEDALAVGIGIAVSRGSGKEE